MTPDEITDPRTFRWVESGVSGLARSREWDATTIVVVPELEGEEAPVVEFAVLADGALRLEGGASRAAADRLAREIEKALAPPFAVRAVRKTGREWLVAARRLRSEVVALPAGVKAQMLEVVVAPDGELVRLVDGEMASEAVNEAVERALAELERRGRARFQAFVARANRLENDSWELTIDPL